MERNKMPKNVTDYIDIITSPITVFNFQVCKYVMWSVICDMLSRLEVHLAQAQHQSQHPTRDIYLPKFCRTVPPVLVHRGTWVRRSPTGYSKPIQSCLWRPGPCYGLHSRIIWVSSSSMSVQAVRVDREASESNLDTQGHTIITQISILFQTQWSC